MRLGILGPRGLVGEELLRLLEKKPWADRVSLISTRQKTSPVLFRRRETPVTPFATILAKRERFDLLLSLAETGWAKAHLKKFFGSASVIIDESSAFRLSPDVPLIVPEVNGELLRSGIPKLITSPNCTTTVLVAALQPLLKLSGLKTVVVASYQAASGAGRAGLNAFLQESLGLAQGKPLKKSSCFPRPLAGNLFPQIGALNAAGDSEEEEKVERETQKILGMASLPVFATCVRVPVARGHSLAIWAEMERPVSQEALCAAYAHSKAVRLKNPYPTPLETAGKEGVFIGRLRAHPGHPPSASLWACGDNLLKGAASNVLEIAERVRPYIKQMLLMTGGAVHAI